MGHDKVFIKVAVHTHPTVSPEWSLQKKEDCKHLKNTPIWFFILIDYKYSENLELRCKYLLVLN